MAELKKEYSHDYFLTAGESNAQGEMPLTLMANRIIEVATEHANSWGVGYSTLVKDHQGWVLSRLVVEMERFPTINEPYTLTTWIEDYNRHFSQRNFRISDSNGNTIGYARTIWVVIDTVTRESVDISKFSYMTKVISQIPCPIDKPGRLTPVTDGREYLHRFTFTDIDFYRHVNTVRYIQLLLNRFSLQHYDESRIRRFEIAFLKECAYDEEVIVRTSIAGDEARQDIIDHDGVARCRAKVIYAKRNQ